jgi:hypothetical protein
MAVQREWGGGIVTQVIDWFEIWIGENLDTSFSSREKYRFSIPGERHLVRLDCLLMRGNWCW